MINFPSKFNERYRKIIDDYENFLNFCRKLPRKCIRINTLKVKDIDGFIENLSKRYRLERVPFCPYAYFIDHPDPGKIPEHFFGEIYVQDAASMIPPIALDINPENDEFIFDACAAPGSKTTQMAQIMNNKGCIIANDISNNRIKALFSNIESCGVMNTIVTGIDMIKPVPKKLYDKFTKILVDAPCSSEGTIRKNFGVLLKWNPYMFNLFSSQQKRIIKNAIKMLKKDGILVYSTCTYAPEENEEVIDFALKNFDVEIEEIKIENLKTREGITEWNGKEFNKDVKKCIRIYPQDNDTEGFFVARLRKI